MNLGGAVQAGDARSVRVDRVWCHGSCLRRFELVDGCDDLGRCVFLDEVPGVVEDHCAVARKQSLPTFALSIVECEVLRPPAQQGLPVANLRQSRENLCQERSAAEDLTRKYLHWPTRLGGRER